MKNIIVLLSLFSASFASADTFCTIDQSDSNWGRYQVLNGVTKQTVPATLNDLSLSEAINLRNTLVSKGLCSEAAATSICTITKGYSRFGIEEEFVLSFGQRSLKTHDLNSLLREKNSS